MRKIYSAIGLQAAFFLFPVYSLFSQTLPGLLPLTDADSAYIRKFVLKNDARLFYGLQGNNLSLGSARDGETRINGDLYKNTNDYIGAGVSYGWLDGDLSFAIPGTTYLNQERSTLTQFKLALSYTRRKIVLRGFYTESTGVVISGSDNEFESTPSIQEQRFGLQITYLFNPQKYSYRAAVYQSEYQMQTAGSFLLRFDPFYRRFGTSDTSIIPAAFDLTSRFGQQAGLEYIQSPGLVVLPGYGINIVIGDTRFFISPIVFAGLGFAHNMYSAVNGPGSFTSLEYAANAVLNAGYSGSKYYTKLQINWTAGYTSMDPTYLTNSNLTCLVMVGMRFRDLK
jgi:hypothetical protein